MSRDKPDQPRSEAGHEDEASIEDAAQDWFLLLSSGEETEADRARFEDWLAADARHRTAFEEIRALWQDVDALEGAFDGTYRTPPPAQARPRRRAKDRRSIGSAAAAACLILTVGLATDWPTKLLADHHTGVGEQARVTLPDGSVAWLNTDTALDVAYNSERRRVFLRQGEAHFEVVPDSGRPFDVRAQGGQSRAVGTAYTVHDQADGASVTVSEGAVTVLSPVNDDERGQSEAAGRRTITAGEKVRYPSGGPPGPVQSVDASEDRAWRSGFIAIEGQRLADALAEIDRYRPGRIVLLADGAAPDRVTARLSIDAIDDGLEALAATQDLAITRLTDYLVIVH